RPLYERQAELWDDVQRRRLEVRPGITGYAQAYGRGQLTIEKKIEMDVHYVDNHNLWFDLQIIMRTVGNVFRSGGEVYEKQYSDDEEYENDR
ncbi:MAG: sugar transferase, partial [bacterium]|nr:sugar transferase [bacterium]